MFKAFLGQINPFPIRRRLKNPHHDTQDMVPLCAAALVVSVLVQGGNVLFNEPVIIQLGWT